MQVTGKAQRQAWQDRVMPAIEQVRDGLWSIPVPIPDSPLRYTLTYAIEDRGGLVVVDPGWESEAGWTALTDGLASIGASAADVAGVVVTHAHADHLGLAAQVREASGAWVAMHRAEVETLPRNWWNDETGQATDEAWLRRCGVPAAEVPPLRLTARGMGPYVSQAAPDVLLEDGDRLPLTDSDVRTIWTPGHTPGHICLYDEARQVLMTGDHVLPRITPNIGLERRDSDAPLAAYLQSLEKMASWNVAEALPAHEYRFRGIANRVRVLRAHHDHRCAEVLGVLGQHGPSTAFDVAQELTWSRGWGAVTGLMRRAAVAEALAHLQYLVSCASVAAEQGDGDEAIRYVAITLTPATP